MISSVNKKLKGNDMKRAIIFILSAAMMVMVSSCSKENPDITPDTVKMVSATINADSVDGDTKTTATKEGDVYKIKWVKDDQLSVFNSENTDMSLFTTNNTGANAKFTGEIPEESAIVAAIFPYNAKASVSADKQTVYTNVPTEQSGAFNNVVLAGWPKPEDEQTKATEVYDFKYQFEAVCGIVKFSFDPARIAEGKTITSISLTIDQPLCGDAKISYAGEKPAMTPNPNATGSNVYNTITILKKEGFTAGDYYFATFPINANGDEGLNIVIRFETSIGDVAYTHATLKAQGEMGNKHIFAANIVKNIGNVKVEKYDKITGAFTVNSSGKKVYFAPGNLQYQASTGLWRFAHNQWDAQGELGNLTRPTGMTDNGPRATQPEWIDLFPWGHTGWTKSDKTFYPYNACPQYNTYLPLETNIVDTDGDWGHYCDIINGDKVDPKGTWRLPTLDEFNFIISSRTDKNAGIKTVRYQGNEWNYSDALLLFMKCGIKTGVIGSDGKEIIRYGVMLFPDGFTWPTDFPIPGEGYKNNFVSNANVTNEMAWTYSLTEFSVFEAAGVVFLPSAGKWHTDQNTYEMSFVFNDTSGQNPHNTFNTEGYYWTSSHSHIASYIANVLRTATNAAGQGCSVRLVKNGEGW